EYELETGFCTETGHKQENQDAAGIKIPQTDSALTYKGIAIAIADGVSACDDGKAASHCCLTSLLSDYYATSDSWTVKKSVEKVLLATNRWLYAQGTDQAGQGKTMASTLSAVIVKSVTAHLVHIGDSRIYRLRQGKLEQLTKDHSWGNTNNQYLLRAMGIDLGFQLDYKTLAVETGDVFLLTTDGVHNYISNQSMLKLLESESDLNSVARKIVNHAFDNGSPDNLTCQIVRFNALPYPDENEVYRKLSELPFPPDLEPGMKMDGYLIKHEIHASSRCQVYLAEDMESGKTVVIKTPSVNYEDDPAYLELFRHEEWVGNRVKSPHVMKTLKPVRERSFLYHVVEYIEGITLQQWMDDHPRPQLQEVRNLVGQIVRGVNAFHRMEMLHQDIKPDNIMIDRFGTVKLIDFGSAKIAGIEEISSPIQRISLLGTKHYAAAEYFLGYAGSQRSDQFSLAVIVYQMLSGKLPYGDKYGEGEITRSQYISVRSYNPDIPIWVDKTLEKALSIDPDKRYPELSEFIYDLSHPNSSFIQLNRQPLLERNPLIFWKTLAILSLLLNIAILIWFNSR
ncbi:MAG TPA: bifunctional protein-serine/threonine kinase/phosphatase, partial [Crenotrichaceae bacterium]|nr:bifunctional protein-serine/threonine kinase/phosphatase [Crenotrichaceae bacterium]